MSVDPAPNASNRRWLGLAAAVMIAACGACGDDGDTAAKFVAVGTLLEDGPPDVAYAKSIGAAAKRREGTRVTEFAVRGDDARSAVDTCNRAMLDYVNRDTDPQRETKLALEKRIEELRAELTKGPTERPELVKEYERTVGRLQELTMSELGRPRAQIVDSCTLYQRGAK